MTFSLTPPLTERLGLLPGQDDITPRLYPRAQFEAHYRALAALHADALKQSAGVGTQPQAVCTVTQRKHFAPLFGDNAAAVMVYFLPRQFEPLLAQLAQKGFEAVNWTALDLSRSITYCAWYAREQHPCVGSSTPDETLWSVVLPDYVFDAYESHNNEVGAPPLALHQERGQLHPTIFAAGDTVAVGGFWVDDYLSTEVAVAAMTACDYHPQLHFTKQELAHAKRCHRCNPTPWRHQLYSMPARSDWIRTKLIEPAAYNYLDGQPA